MLRAIIFITSLFEFDARNGCPFEYAPINNNTCVYQLGFSAHFCDACELCFEYGQVKKHFSFLMGRNTLTLKSPFTGRLWTGYNALLSKKIDKTTIWYDVDTTHPEIAVTSANFSNELADLTSAKPIIIYTGAAQSFATCPTGITIPIDVACEYGGVLEHTSFEDMYRGDFPIKVVDFIQTQESMYGCSEVKQAESAIECAKICTMDIRCRSIYFNWNNIQCIHMLYADALLPSTFANDSSGWIRLAKAFSSQKPVFPVIAGTN